MENIHNICTRVFSDPSPRLKTMGVFTAIVTGIALIDIGNYVFFRSNAPEGMNVHCREIALKGALTGVVMAAINYKNHNKAYSRAAAEHVDDTLNKLLLNALIKKSSKITFDVRLINSDLTINYIKLFLKNNPYITHLDFRLYDSPLIVADGAIVIEGVIGMEGSKKIAKVLAGNTTLTSLDLEWNNIRDEGAVAIARTLEKNNSLTSLNIGGNIIGDEGAIAIARILEKNNSLTSLNIGGNEIGTRGAVEIAQILENNNSLTSLNIGGNIIGDEGAIAIARILEGNKTLLSLNIGYNQIGAEGASTIARTLEDNNTLLSLNIGFNQIGDESALLRFRNLLSDLNTRRLEQQSKAAESGFLLYFPPALVTNILLPYVCPYLLQYSI